MLFSKPSAVITEITATPVPVAAIFPLRDTVAIFSFDEEYLIAAPFALPSAAFAMAFINADCFSSSLYESKSVVIPSLRNRLFAWGLHPISWYI